jgi:hypothetical protein
MVRHAVYRFIKTAKVHSSGHIKVIIGVAYDLLKLLNQSVRSTGFYDKIIELALYLKSGEGFRRLIITTGNVRQLYYRRNSKPVAMNIDFFLLFHFGKTVFLAVASTLIAWYKTSTKEARRARKLKQLIDCREEVREMIKESNCNPLMLRMAWAEASSYDRTIHEWPRCGGVNGSLQYEFEYDHPNNKGLSKAYVMLLAIKRHYKAVSWADIFQMAGAVGVELAGGPKVEIRYGRVDAPPRPMEEAERGMKPRYILATRQPRAIPPYPDGAPSADVHIRNSFFRMGFTTREIVALCGAHTIGRAFKNRSGVCPCVGGDQGMSKYTQHSSIAKVGCNIL